MAAGPVLLPQHQDPRIKEQCHAPSWNIPANSLLSLSTTPRTLPAQPVSMETHQNEFDQESSSTPHPYSVRKQCQVSPFVVTIIYSSRQNEVRSLHRVAPAGLQEHQCRLCWPQEAHRELWTVFMCG